MSFIYRKHFFSDWHNLEPFNAKDITSQISDQTISVVKYLNYKNKNEHYISEDRDYCEKNYLYSYV